MKFLELWKDADPFIAKRCKEKVVWVKRRGRLSLFRYFARRGEEDISTEVVAYLLRSKEKYTLFQKKFFNRVLNKPSSSKALHADIITQPDFRFGRPDFIILTQDSLIVGETKLGSYLSGDDQLVRYHDVFNNIGSLGSYFFQRDMEGISSKVLAFLAPLRIIDYSRKICDEICENKFGMDFLHWLGQEDISFTPLPWEEIIDDLDVNDTLQKELFLLVDYYLTQELNEEETMVLKNVDVPSALNKLFKLIEDMRNELTDKEYKVSRLGQSYNFFGFFMESDKFKCWFGYFLPIWAEHKTPVFLQVRDSWIKEEKDKVLQKLMDKSFIKEKEHEFICPFQVDSIASWKQELIELLSYLSSD